MSPENDADKMPEKDAKKDGAKPKTLALPPRRRSRRALVMALILAAIFGLLSLHNGGYAMLIGWKDETAPGDAKVAVLRCTYFTGTERIINHTFRNMGDNRGKPKCPAMIRMNLGDYAPGGAQDPNVITIPAGRVIQAHPPAAPSDQPAPVPAAPSNLPPPSTSPPSAPPAK